MQCYGSLYGRYLCKILFQIVIRSITMWLLSQIVLEAGPSSINTSVRNSERYQGLSGSIEEKILIIKENVALFLIC